MAVVDATWPAARFDSCGPFLLRAGRGGGKRVSSASAEGPWTVSDLDAAEAGLLAMGQQKLFNIRPGDEALDGALAARGYEIIDPVNIWSCPISVLTAPPRHPEVFGLPAWPVLEIQREIWAEGGIGAARIEVMERAAGPATTLIGRVGDAPAASAFVALSDGVAMLHALEVRKAFRGKGLGRQMMLAAGHWAAAAGAQELAVICTTGNAPANGLYRGLGMLWQGRYHYRIA
ncbi:GNAT family N-acetyltransferase [Pseudooceanicola sp. CBS1P-1]|nr:MULTISPECIES: GNAT family N-acetyltransferase [Pseudooceanicola]MBT9384115.1 GNAT family N-acetyltransferase [Pseudooceanicola endophyticus]